MTNLSGPPVVPVEWMNISGVERDTGLSKDVLRVWERRYGFPRPGRDENGERQYPPEQVLRLRAIKRLMDIGMRPSRLIGLDVSELNRLAAVRLPPPAQKPEADLVAEALRLLRSHDVGGLQQTLTQALMKLGLQRFIEDVVGSLNRAVGEAWTLGQLQIFEEHLYSEQVQMLLRSAISAFPARDAAPAVLLTTLPQEQHTIGLLMVEAFLAAESVRCVALGPQTPIGDICLAAGAHRVHVVALSFSPAFPLRQAADSLAALRRQLPADIQLWAGGELMRRMRRNIPAVRILTDFPALAAELALWRRAWAQRAAAAIPPA